MNRVIIDVREPDEFKEGHAEGAINVPLGHIMSVGLPGSIGKNNHIVVYCNSGNRSAMAKQILDAKGYVRITNGINKQTVEAKDLN